MNPIKKILPVTLTIFLMLPLTLVFADTDIQPVETISEEVIPDENNLEETKEEELVPEESDSEEIISDETVLEEIPIGGSVSSNLACSDQYDTSMYFEDGTLALHSILQSPKECEIEDDGLPPFDITYLHGVTINEENSPFVLDLMFDYPIDEDFSHFRIYRNGEMVESYYKVNRFIDSNVKPDTFYIYKIISVDIFGNHSLGYIQSIKTDIVEDKKAPKAPTGVLVTSGNQAGRVTWSRNIESDLSGYNVYMNGVRHNSEILTATNYYINGLDNDSMYSIAVTAVDESGNESLYSITESLNPIMKQMPVFKSDTSFQTIGEGTNKWFSKLWPILAFAVGIPLTFYIATRIKGLILN